jgi:hypothetical protein
MIDTVKQLLRCYKKEKKPMSKGGGPITIDRD